MKYQNHYYTYFAHCSVGEGSARDFLLSLPSPQLPGFGENQGTGLIFHAQFPEHGWGMQVTIDHSNVIPAGLFVQCVTGIAADHAHHQDTVRHIDGLFRHALNSVGLEFVRSVG